MPALSDKPTTTVIIILIGIVIIVLIIAAIVKKMMWCWYGHGHGHGDDDDDDGDDDGDGDDDDDDHDHDHDHDDDGDADGEDEDDDYGDEADGGGDDDDDDGDSGDDDDDDDDDGDEGHDVEGDDDHHNDGDYDDDDDGDESGDADGDDDDDDDNDDESGVDDVEDDGHADGEEEDDDCGDDVDGGGDDDDDDVDDESGVDDIEDGGDEDDDGDDGDGDDDFCLPLFLSRWWCRLTLFMSVMRVKQASRNLNKPTLHLGIRGPKHFRAAGLADPLPGSQVPRQRLPPHIHLCVCASTATPAIHKTGWEGDPPPAGHLCGLKVSALARISGSGFPKRRLCQNSCLWWLGVAHSSLFGSGFREFSLLGFEKPPLLGLRVYRLAFFQELGCCNRRFRKYTSLQNGLPSMRAIIAGAAHNSVS